MTFKTPPDLERLSSCDEQVTDERSMEAESVLSIPGAQLGVIWKNGQLATSPLTWGSLVNKDCLCGVARGVSGWHSGGGAKHVWGIGGASGKGRLCSDE